jgi:CheY-like chemotaxis protein
MPKTLLLADDSVTIQKVVGITFANQDVELVTVDNGDDALVRAREIKPDAVLADVNMPGLDGYELCRAIRAEPDLMHIPVLLLTGTFETYDESRAEDVGANAHIAKPFEAQALVDEVYRMLEAPVLRSEPEPEPEPESAEPLIPEPERIEPPAPQGMEFSFDDLDFDSPARAYSSPEETQLLRVEPLDGEAGFDSGAETPPLESQMEDFTQLDTGTSPDSLYGDLVFIDPVSGDSQDTKPSAEEQAALPTADPLSVDPDSLSEPFVEGIQDLRDDSDILGDPLPPMEPPLAVAPDDSTATGSGDTTPLKIEADPIRAESTAEELLFAEPISEELQPALPADDEVALDLTEPAEPLGDESPLSPFAAVETSASRGQEAPPLLDERAVREALEKLAWEAFGPLSAQLVNEVVRKVEAIAWEVVPKMAERLIRDEIERMKEHTPK